MPSVSIGATGLDTINNLIASINANETLVIARVLSDAILGDLNKIIIDYKTIGTAGNSYTLAESGPVTSVSASTLLGGKEPLTVYSGTISTNIIVLSRPMHPTNGFFLHTIVRNASRSTDKYAVVISVSDEYPLSPTLTLNKDVQALGWTSNDILVFYKSDMYAAMSDVVDKFLYRRIAPMGFVNLGGKNDLSLFGAVERYLDRQIWIGRITNRKYFNNAFSFNGNYATSLMEDFTSGPILKTSQPIELRRQNAGTDESPIDIVSSTQSFSYSFSFVFDNFNESILYRDDNYGPSVSGESFVLTNRLVLANISGDDNTRVAELRITIPDSEIINRRITGIRIYGRSTSYSVVKLPSGKGVLNQSEFPWRFCKGISINDTGWTYSAGKYQITARVGNEVNVGILFTESHGFSYRENLLKKPLSAVASHGRHFIVNEKETSIVYYSPIGDGGFNTSVLPDSNFILFNRDISDISSLQVVNNKLLIMKRSAIISYSLEIEVGSSVDLYIDSSDGIASALSVAMGEKVLFYAAYNSINVTDGFKVISINQDWIDKYISYPKSDRESSVGFYDHITHSYYIQIGSDLWVFDTKSNKWHNDSIRRDIRGAINYVSYTPDGDSVIYCNNEVSLYEFPRLDGLYKDTLITNGVLTDYDIDVLAETNDIFSENGLDVLVYTNSGYIIGAGIEDATSPGITLSVIRGGVIIRSAVINKNNFIFSLNTRSPLDKFSVRWSGKSKSKLSFKEIGLEVKSMRRIGNQRIGAIA